MYKCASLMQILHIHNAHCSVRCNFTHKQGIISAEGCGLHLQISMSRKGGYTEAELLAAEWSKERKKEAENERSSKDKPSGSRQRDAPSNWESRDTSTRIYERDRSNRMERNDRSDRNMSCRGRSKSRSRSRSPQAYSMSDRRRADRDDQNRHSEYKTRNEVRIDEFGRIVEPGRVIAKAREDKVERRSRSRSRSRSADNRRDRGSRGSWRHDKFDSRDSSPVQERRELPRDYRPPSPTWVSKAGGVAIIRKKTES